MSREGCIGPVLQSAGRSASRHSGTPPCKERGFEPRSLNARALGSDRQRNRLTALRRVDDAHIDLLALGEMGNAGRLEDRYVDEHVLAAVFARNEAETLDAVEPLDFAGDRNGCRRIRGNAPRSRRIAERALRALDDTGRVDFEHPRHLGALGAGADLDAQFRAGGHRLVPGVLQRIGVQERVALAAGQLDEAVALVGLEPLHDRIDHRGARIDRRRGPPAHRRAAVAAFWSAAVAARRPGLRIIGHRSIVIEAALARPKVLTLAHISPTSPTKALFGRDARRPSRSPLTRRNPNASSAASVAVGPAVFPQN